MSEPETTKPSKWLWNYFMEDTELLTGIAGTEQSPTTLESLCAANPLHLRRGEVDRALYAIWTEEWVGMRFADGKRETIVEQQQDRETKRDVAFLKLRTTVEEWKAGYESERRQFDMLKATVEKWLASYQTERLKYDFALFFDKESKEKTDATRQTLALAHELALSIDRCLAVSPSRLSPEKRRGRHPSRSRMGWRALAIVAAHIVTTHRREALTEQEHKALGLNCRRFVCKHRDLFEVPASLKDWQAVNKDLPKHKPRKGTPEALWLEALMARCPEYHPR